MKTSKPRILTVIESLRNIVVFSQLSLVVSFAKCAKNSSRQLTFATEPKLEMWTGGTDVLQGFLSGAQFALLDSSSPVFEDVMGKEAF